LYWSGLNFIRQPRYFDGKTNVRGMIVRGIKAREVFFPIPLTIIPLTNLLQNE